ncbi:ATP-dependent helicase [Lysinimonas soli]|uniref:DNA 3'-5' helicase n=1 Tax=Lysinimonas soli TaxID=1074233 RepID=A0ABW0NQ75_9MICO
MSGLDDELLAGLDPEQREAATRLLGPVCILAGAGTGKTRALTYRIAHGLRSGTYSPGSVLALTFTTKAAGELRERLRQLGASGATTRTFHSAALQQLTQFWPDLVGGPPPKLVENKARLISEAGDAARIRLGGAVLRELATEIEWRKTSELSIAGYAVAAQQRAMPAGLDVDAVVDIQTRYEGLKDERRRLDFEDVLLATAGMLDAEPRVLAQVHAQFRFFTVDEYQDVSPLQHRLLELWRGDRTDVCVVGDASQTIYSFTGASSSYLLQFEREFPQASVVRLERNYRSTPGVLTLANRLMRDRPGALQLRATSSVAEPVPGVAAFDDDAAEASAVADAVVKELASGIRPEQIAVLFRVNEQAAAVEAALRQRGVAVRQLGASKFFQLSSVRMVTSALRVQARSHPDESMLKVVSDLAREAGWSIRPEDSSLPRENWDALDAIVRFASSLPTSVTLERFSEELSERAESNNELTVSAVVLSTLHSAKGLEWDTVFLIGLCEGLLPVSYARGEAAIDEERRLLYVGITRARRRLRMSWSRTGSRGQQREPSRFLAELNSGTRGAATRRAG